MFTIEDFDIFDLPTLDGRMAAIRKDIQPKFQEMGTFVKEELEKELGVALFLHIAQHKRRTVYPPESTWLAIGPYKRGYKMEPHFQIRISKDGVAFLLSIIDQPKGQQEYAHRALEKMDALTALPDNYVVSKDHTKEIYLPLKENIKGAFERLEKVKKSEVEVGRFLTKEEVLFSDETSYHDFLKETFLELVPIYEIYLKNLQF